MLARLQYGACDILNDGSCAERGSNNAILSVLEYPDSRVFADAPHMDVALYPWHQTVREL